MCVIFRLDDVRNGYLEKVQISLMNFFLSNNDRLSLGLIMNNIEDGSSLVQKIQEGKNLGLFELDIHGWDHVDSQSYLNMNKRRLFTKLMKRCTPYLEIIP